MDIQKIVSELLDTDLNQQDLADLVPCHQSTISAFLNGSRGSRPSLTIGLRLAELHKARCSHSFRATDPTPHTGHGVCQPASPRNILDTAPDRAVITPPPAGDKP